MNDFGERLKKALITRDMTQDELASYAETTGATISRYANAKRAPSAHLLGKIAAALNVSTDYLLGISNDSFPDDQSMLALSEEEISLIRLYRTTAPEMRAAICMILSVYEKATSVDVDVNSKFRASKERAKEMK